MDVLAELGAGDKPTLTVFNKIDLLPDRDALNPLRRHFPEALFISTRTGEGLPELLHAMAGQLVGRTERLELLLPPDRGDLLGLLHKNGQVLATEYTAEGTRVRAVMPSKGVAPFAPFRVTETEASPLPMPVPAPAAEDAPLLHG